MLADDLIQKLVQVAEIEIRARQSPAEDFGLDQFFKDPPSWRSLFERPFLSVGPLQSP